MAHNVKSIRAQFKAKGVFYTDEALAQLLKSLMPSGLSEVYDPTCGDGALLSVFPDDVRKFGQELDPEQAEAARQRLKNSEIAVGDVLTNPVFADRRFKGIMANYPFSIKWNPPANPKADPVFADAPAVPTPARADYAFMLHIIHCLADDGVAAVLNYPGVCYRGQREGAIRKWMIERNFVDKVIAMEGGHFVDTKTSTVIFVFRKNRTEDFIFMRDNEQDVERNVPIAEIAANDYTLNVSSFVTPPEPEQPKKDPWEMESRAREAAIKRLRAEISFSQGVACMEGWSITPFLDQLQAVIDDFRTAPSNPWGI